MGRETPCHVRGLSPVTKSTVTIAGTQQMSRSSCCPAIPAAWCSIVGLNGERSPSGHTGHAPNRQVDPSLPSPSSSSQGPDDSAGDTALTEILRSSCMVTKGYLTQGRMSFPAPSSLLQGMSTSGSLRSRHGA